MSAKRDVLYAVATIFFLTAQLPLGDAAAGSLDKRVQYYGGFSLQIPPSVQCPAGSHSCNGAVDLTTGPCCPEGTFCAELGPFCCPTTQSCNDAVNANPTCADPSWVLFIEPLGGTQFGAACCPVGMVVDIKYQCVPPGGSGDSAQFSSFVSSTQANDATPPAGSSTTSSGTTAASTTTTTAATTTTTGTISTGLTASSTPATTPSITGNSATGNSGTQTSSQSTPASTSQKSGGHQTILTYGKVAWVVMLLSLFV